MLLNDHVESTHALLEQWEQQSQKQQVVPENAESYFSFFRAPLTAYQKVIEAVETVSKQSLDVSHSQYNAPYFSVFP